MTQKATQSAAAIRKLVALKRQRAEQVLAQTTTALRAADAEVSRLRAELSALDQTSADYVDIALSARFGRSGFILKQIETAEARRAACRTELEAARDALRRVIHSENQLGG